MAMTAAEELTKAEARLAKYEAAEDRILKSQSWQKGGTAAQRANLKYVQEQIDKLTDKIRKLSTKPNGKIRVRNGVPSE